MKRTIITSVLALACSCPAWAEGAPISVDGGQISGTSTDGVRIFKGIPFAAPPVGELRWQPPQPVVAWEGVRQCDTFGAACAQPPRSKDSFYYQRLGKTNEDCLFLNVWTAAESASEKRPVMVWIHGGALTQGAGSLPSYDGSALARKGVVVVTINYRLGPLGYLAHPELSKESEHDSSGNYGVLDQIAALQWVQRNVAAFGGDPGRVTIFGESAGSWSVNVLVASPLAKGLFHRAIGQSGGLFGPTARLRNDPRGRATAEDAGMAFAKAAGADSLAAMRALPVERIIEVFADGDVRPNVDRWVLPDEVRTIFAEGKHNDVPVLIGSNANEWTTLTAPASIPRTRKALDPYVKSTYGDLSAEFYAAYPVQSGDDAAAAYLDSMRDRWFTLHMRTWARLTATRKSPAYLYYFTHVPPMANHEYLGAYHAAEIPYVFNNLQTVGLDYGQQDHKLAQIMSDYWVNFATSGNPNGKDLPMWTPYDQTSEPYMELGGPYEMGYHLLKDQLDFIEKAVTRKKTS